MEVGRGDVCATPLALVTSFSRKGACSRRRGRAKASRNVTLQRRCSWCELAARVPVARVVALVNLLRWELGARRVQVVALLSLQA